MCGRFTLYDNKDVLEDEFEVEIQPELLTASYNIAPTQNSLVIYTEADRRVCNSMRWGLVPYWSKDIKIGYKMINARAETIDEKGSFKKPLKDKRCLVLTNGFYEWQKVDSKTKIPYFVRLKNKKPFSFAGLWDHWEKEGNDLYTFTIITTDANKLMEPIHDRMPVILDKEGSYKWLDPVLKDARTLKGLLKPYPSEEMEVYEISKYVNTPKNNSADCIKPV
ncbi:MAG: SOS response-associated peptidase [Candidatus Dadabacteria bacterium]|nr:SOS response-associated peptidase [Candidatus Dadabacteria bacterium]NIY20842.1 SOS response-associated peptidase [Candidatus Dadabacteria bacterium]